jgi:hypothetical protein
MQKRFLTGIAGVFLVMAVGAGQATAWEHAKLIPLTLSGHLAFITAGNPSRLAALDARQQLRDQVCYAMADGRISRPERQVLLENAKRVLRPEEYTAFRESLDRLSPPMPATGRNATMVAKRGSRQPRPLAPAPAPTTQVVAVSSPTSAGATEIVVTEHVASNDEAR